MLSAEKKKRTRRLFCSFMPNWDTEGHGKQMWCFQINRLCSSRAELTFVQGHIGRVEVHQAADVRLVAQIGRRLLLPRLRWRICNRSASKHLGERKWSLLSPRFTHALVMREQHRVSRSNCTNNR